MNWNPPETAPKNGKAFIVTTAGPNVDICYWDVAQKSFVDYFYKQRIKPEWPYMVGWQPLPDPAVVGNSEAESRSSNKYKAQRRKS